MDIQEKTHAFTNLTVGSAAILSPVWMNAINITECLLHFMTVLGGFILVVFQLKRMYDKSGKNDG